MKLSRLYALIEDRRGVPDSAAPHYQIVQSGFDRSGDAYALVQDLEDGNVTLYLSDGAHPGEAAEQTWTEPLFLAQLARGFDLAVQQMRIIRAAPGEASA